MLGYQRSRSLVGEGETGAWLQFVDLSALGDVEVLRRLGRDLRLLAPLTLLAAGAIEGAAGGLDTSAQIYMLLAFLFLSISLSPIATAAALRMSMS